MLPTMFCSREHCGKHQNPLLHGPILLRSSRGQENGILDLPCTSIMIMKQVCSVTL